MPTRVAQQLFRLRSFLTGCWARAAYLKMLNGTETGRPLTAFAHTREMSGPGLSARETSRPGVVGGCAGRLKVFAHATESRTPTTGVTPTAWCAATPSARDCKRHGADARHAGQLVGNRRSNKYP